MIDERIVIWMADKQLNMRLSEETRAMFDELVKSSGMTQAEYFASLLQGAKTEELKALVPNSAEEIDELEGKLARVRELYMIAVKRSSEAYEVASYKVKDQLEQLAAAMAENKQLKTLKAENERLSGELETAKAQAAEADGLRNRLAEAREQLLTLREQHTDELEKAKAESAKQLNEARERGLAEAQAKAAEADDLRNRLVEAREQILSLREQHADELEKARAEGFAQIMEYVKAQQGK